MKKAKRAVKAKTTARKSARPRRSRSLHAQKLVRTGPLKLEGLGKMELREIHHVNRIRATITGTRIFDRTVHKTNAWLKEVMRAMDWNNRERAYQALRATLHSVRDVLTFEEVLQLGAQLPILLRGVYFEGWSPKTTPVRLKSPAEFFLLVRLHLGPGPKFTNGELRDFTHACIHVIARHISEGELREVKAILPRKLKALIPLPGEEGWEEIAG